jgi:hypothetical protein
MRIAAAPGTLVREWELDQGEKIVLGIERINLAP